MDHIKDLLSNTGHFWEGKGEKAHETCVKEQYQMGDEALVDIKDTINRIIQAAGIYEEAEQEAISVAEELPDDVIF